MNFYFLFFSYALSDQIAWNRLGNNSKNTLMSTSDRISFNSIGSSQDPAKNKLGPRMVFMAEKFWG